MTEIQVTTKPHTPNCRKVTLQYDDPSLADIDLIAIENGGFYFGIDGSISSDEKVSIEGGFGPDAIESVLLRGEDGSILRQLSRPNSRTDIPVAKVGVETLRPDSRGGPQNSPPASSEGTDQPSALYFGGHRKRTGQPRFAFAGGGEFPSSCNGCTRIGDRCPIQTGHRLNCTFKSSVAPKWVATDPNAGTQKSVLHPVPRQPKITTRICTRCNNEWTPARANNPSKTCPTCRKEISNAKYNEWLVQRINKLRAPGVSKGGNQKLCDVCHTMFLRPKFSQENTCAFCLEKGLLHADLR